MSMNILLILAHSDPASLNHAIARQARQKLELNGHRVIFHDLYAEGFDPRLDHTEYSRGAVIPPGIDRHCWDVAEADGIVVVHPNWWGKPPALLCGWIDRVLRVDVAYRFEAGDNGEGVPVGLLKAKSAVVFNTSNTGREREETAFGDPLERIWKDCVFDLCGVRDFHRRMFRIVCTSTSEERAAWLAETDALIGRIFPKS